MNWIPDIPLVDVKEKWVGLAVQWDDLGLITGSREIRRSLLDRVRGLANRFNDRTKEVATEPAEGWKKRIDEDDAPTEGLCEKQREGVAERDPRLEPLGG